MNHTDLDTQQSRNKFWAYNDARMRNAKEKSHYSQAQQNQAERMAVALRECYSTSGVFINYRKGFIAVKVSDARVKDRFNLQILEYAYDQVGIKKAISDQGVIYRIPKV